MAIAAVPQYLGTDFSTAAPGHRFGMYLKLWGVDSKSKDMLWTTHDVNYRTAGPKREERPFKDENKTSALREALKLNDTDKKAMHALDTRQRQLAAFQESTGQLLSLEAIANAPFTTGLGNEHPLENGFAFLNPYGLPYLPGSGVKGVLRAAARELAARKFGGTEGWTFETIEALFGREGEDGDTEHQRGALMFWDVIPQIKGDSLKVEVMTPHQSHYYQKGESPHESGSPNPINFLTVPPGSGFVFHVQCNRTFIARIAPELVEDNRWKTVLTAAFTHAFDWLGFGAKTAVGYGAMERLSDEEIEKARHESAAAQLKCDWVDATIQLLAKKNSIPESGLGQVLRGRALAEAWAALDEPMLKDRALVDIRVRWEKEGWWDTPPGKASKNAKAIYCGET
ncbi:MAG: type III-B CRISPR module RAMP protein Cmr6 [Gammaproteobacteria bacterium]